MATPIGSSADAIGRLKELDREARRFEHIGALLGWDRETGMPPRAIEERAHQEALISALHHEKITAPRVGELLERADAEEGTPDAAFLTVKRREYEKNTRVPTEFVKEMTELTSRAQAVWATARTENDFPAFEPFLDRIVEMNRRLSDYLGFQDHPYDALLDQYEPYATTAEIDRAFCDLEAGLVPLVAAIAEVRPPDDSFLRHRYPADGQERFSRELMVALGYDLERGRLDRSAHPFTTTLGAQDVRITTRYQEDFLQGSLFGTIHETGHALYELGMPAELQGTLLAEGTSLGVHESQSRLWENMIGRSRPFWIHWLPRLQAIFPTQLEGVSVDQFYRAVNRVAPSHIRVEADEVTYSLHVILRFRLEVALISGDLSVKDVPEAWRATSRALLGIAPESDSTGVLQDVHWSFGGFGYFPTYALGNLYAAQLLDVIQRDIPDLWDRVEEGDTSQVLAWLRSHVHAAGSTRRARELMKDVTGRPLGAESFLSYLTSKYGEIYSL